MVHSDMANMLCLLRYLTASLIVLGGIMHLIGLITDLVRGTRLSRFCWFIYLFAIIVYPIAAVMILKGISWAYWIVLVAPSVGGFVIFLGFFLPDSGFLKLLAGNPGNEITWMAFVQIFSESMAVAYAFIVLYHQVLGPSGAI